MFDRISDARMRLMVVLLAPILVASTGVTAYLIGQFWLALLLVPAVTIAIIVPAWVFRPRWWGETRVHAITLTLFAAITWGILATDYIWIPVVSQVFEWLDRPPPESPAFWERFCVLIFFGGVFVTLNHIWSRRQLLPPTGIANKETKHAFCPQGYKELRDEFCQYMLHQLDRYDVDVHWSDADYTTLEAEIDIAKRGALRAKVAKDLVAAIRNDHLSRAFLLIGNPGAGKSVSLRRLCRELYTTVETTGIVPVYINLREWTGAAEPSDMEISRFILSHLKREAGRAGVRFLNQWYDTMLERGLVFFILDSFDEMPSVLDSDDASPRLKRISEAFDRFLHDIHRCRGVLASRPFRQPRGFRGRRLTVRPFRESQIRTAMKRWMLGHTINAKEVIQRLFTNRPELIPSIRNPFLADLITQYVIRHDGKLPRSQFEMFSDYIDSRLEQDVAELHDLGVSPEEARSAAADIAWAMYHTASGLEIETGQLAKLVAIDGLENLIQALRLCRIIRLGGDKSQHLSFVHRRFAEFFVVRAILERKEQLALQSIPEDSRWRDCLVVYAGVASEDDATTIANYCWTTIGENEDAFEGDAVEPLRPLVHCLRFLRDAFLSRPQCLMGFRNDLSKRLLGWLRSSDVLTAKIAAEGIGLLRPQDRSRGITAAFYSEISWIAETALRASRHLSKLDTEAKTAIRRYVRTLPTPQLLTSFKDLWFSLSLSEDLRPQRWAMLADIIWLFVLWVTILYLGIVTDHGIWLVLFMLILAAGFELLYARLQIRTRRRARGDRDARGAIASLALPNVAIISRILRPVLDTALRCAVVVGPSYFAVLLVVVPGIGEAGRTYSSGFVAPGTLWVCLIVLPWETWWAIVRWCLIRKRIVDWLRPFVYIGAATLAIAIVGGLVSGVVFLAGKAIDWLGIGAFVETAITWGVGILVGVSTLALLVSMCLKASAYWLDRRSIALLRLSEGVSRDWVYRTCGELRSARGRRRFLELLELHNVNATGPSTSIEDKPWMDEDVQVLLAQLECRWNGMED